MAVYGSRVTVELTECNKNVMSTALPQDSASISEWLRIWIGLCYSPLPIIRGLIKVRNYPKGLFEPLILSTQNRYFHLYVVSWGPSYTVIKYHMILQYFFLMLCFTNIYLGAIKAPVFCQIPIFIL